MKLLTTKEADIICSKRIRARDKFCYFNCGRRAIQNSHFWGRGNSGTRYDDENCDGVCGHCHLIHEGNKQGLYRDLKIAQLGMKRYKALEKRARSYMNRQDAIRQFMELVAKTPHREEEINFE